MHRLLTDNAVDQCGGTHVGTPANRHTKPFVRRAWMSVR
jgi:hypothetical protein